MISESILWNEKLYKNFYVNKKFFGSFYFDTFSYVFGYKYFHLLAKTIYPNSNHDRSQNYDINVKSIIEFLKKAGVGKE